MDLEQELSQYDYPITEASIAFEPTMPRDVAKLLVYDRTTKEVSFDTFRNLAQYLPKNTLLVFNDTKVIPARLPSFLPTGGKVELLCLSFNASEITALSPRTLAIGTVLSIDSNGSLAVTAKNESVYHLRYIGTKPFAAVLQKYGTTPIPPYLKQTKLSEKELRTKYQTVFAKSAGSVAAPTASLHFTKGLIAKLKKAGFDSTTVTLHVGMGTFAPLTQTHLDTKRLHTEYYEVTKASLAKIERARKAGRPIIPVGTTALRTLESVYAKKIPAAKGITSLFIQEGYRFKVATGLVTNFHVPRSSLLMLVSALVGRERLLALYALALTRGFKFFSFGDGMLIR
jgi:S-adenosylmethionine:tRNA ribosyltransferase-isomerase